MRDFPGGNIERRHGLDGSAVDGNPGDASSCVIRVDDVPVRGPVAASKVGANFGDRLDIAATPDDHVFIETARGNEQVSNVIDNFADVNGMESCATPGDV